MWKMLEAMSLKVGYHDKLSRKELELVPASARKEDHCCQSGFCCWRAPGELTKDDLKRLSESKGITESEFFKTYCIVDTYLSNDRLIIRLRRKHQDGGEMIDFQQTYSVKSPCVFLTDKGCEVHDHKPACCARYECWAPPVSEKQIDDEMGRWSREELMTLGWDGYNPDEE